MYPTHTVGTELTPFTYYYLKHTVVKRVHSLQVYHKHTVGTDFIPFTCIPNTSYLHMYSKHTVGTEFTPFTYISNTELEKRSLPSHVSHNTQLRKS